MIFEIQFENPSHFPRYATKNLKFGKIDVSRSTKIAEKYNVKSSITSRTLPTLILFKDGHEYMRRPLMDSRDRVIPFSFSYVSLSLLLKSQTFCLITLTHKQTN